MAEIIVKIKNGKAKFEVTGVNGSGCEDLTRALEAAVGKVEDVSRKPQYYVELDELEQKIYEG